MYNSQDDFHAIARRNYSVEIGRFINRGWEIFSRNAAGFIGFCVLTFVISIVLSSIPGMGGIVNGIVSSVLTAGYYIVAFKIAKQQTVEFGDFFRGFQNSYFLPVFLASFVSSLFIFLLVLPLGAGLFLSFYPLFRSIALRQGEDIQDLPELELPTALGMPLLVIGVILLLGAIYLGVAYSFTLPLVIDRRAGFWTAMETSRRLISSHWFEFFFFTFVLGLINFGGALACGVGLIFTLPLTICAIAAAYEDIVGLSINDF